MKVLHLTLKKKWFDMIARGEKNEEYRELKDYWATRLVDEIDFNPREDESWVSRNHEFRIGMITPKAFDIVSLKNGYSINAPKMKFKIDDILVWAGKYEWGAEPGKKYFVIKLGERIN